MSQAVTKIVTSGLNFIKRQHHNLKVNMLRRALENAFVQMITQYQSIYMRGLGADPAQIGMVYSAGRISEGAAALPTGRFADRYGPKKIFLISAAIMALGSLVFALAQNWVATLPALFIFIFGQRFGGMLCNTVCGRYAHPYERTLTVQLCDTIVSAPILIVPTISALIVTAFGGITLDGIRPLYYVAAAGYCLVLAMTLRLYRGEPIEPAGKTSGKSQSFIGDYHEVFTEGTAIKRWLAFSVFDSITMMAFPVYWPLFAQEVKGADQFLIAAMTTVQFIVPLLLALPIGRLADTIGKKKIFYALVPFNAMAPLLLIYAPNVVFLLLALAAAGASNITIRVLNSIRSELVPARLLGKFAGILTLVRASTGLVVMAVSGVIYRDLGPQYVFTLLAAIRIIEPFLLRTIPEVSAPTP